MKPLFLLSFALFIPFILSAQNNDTSRINRAISPDQLLAPLRYLASDRLKGRHVGLPEIDTAARYIADQFRQAGAKPVPGATGYYLNYIVKFIRSYILVAQYIANDPPRPRWAPGDPFEKDWKALFGAGAR
jgi:hypothetical protein